MNITIKNAGDKVMEVIVTVLQFLVFLYQFVLLAIFALPIAIVVTIAYYKELQKEKKHLTP